jgi:GT2 family glycosyltransferase
MSVTVIILNWNSEDHLEQCLRCLAEQTLPPAHVLVINNGPGNERLDRMVRSWPELDMAVEHLGANHGFAAANNLGARLARDQWIALLNADAFPEPDWLANLLEAGRQNPDYSFFSSRQIQARNPEWLDGAGDAYHISGLAWRHGYNHPSARFGHELREVFSACGAAALIAREEFLAVGGFDEEYFSYFEDVDLGFRLRLRGAKCLYVPGAVVRHVGSGSTGQRSDFSVYHGYRNMIWTFFKDMPSPLIWIFLPLHLSAILFFALYLTLRGQGQAIWKAILDALVGLPRMIRKRKLIQKNKTIRTRDVLRVMSTGLLEPLQEFRLRKKPR